MKADLIVKNANIYTVDKKQPWAEALAVKNGKLIFVGSNNDADAYDGPVKNAEGRFIIPGLIDSHVHMSIPCCSRVLNDGYSEIITADSKQDFRKVLSNYIKEHPDFTEYHVYFDVNSLHGEKLTRDNLDEICPDKPLQIDEMEHHSCWMNTAMLRKKGISEYEQDIAYGLSYFDRDSDGRINGRAYEFCQNPINEKLPSISVEQYEDGLKILLDFWKKMGVVACFEAGTLGCEEGIDNFFRTLNKLEKEEKLPQYVECCEYIIDPKQRKGAVERLHERDRKFKSDQVRIRTVKIMLDGTLNGRTAALYEPYLDCDTNGGILFDKESLADFLVELNKCKNDVHFHAVGDRAVGTVLEAVDIAQQKTGKENFTIQVTCAHNELIPNSLLGEFARLGVIANFTPSWFGSQGIDSRYEDIKAAIGKKRADTFYRVNSVWNTGALVTFSTDYMSFDTMIPWNPYVNIEVGLTHQVGTMFDPIENDYSVQVPFGKEQEKLSLAQLIIGYTINAAKQLRLDDRIGSLELGKDASFLVFDENLFDIDKYQIHKQSPNEVFVKGKLIYSKAMQ